MAKIREGKLMAIQFLDHCEDGSEPCDFTVFGKVAKVAGNHICIDSWVYSDSRRGYDSNVKRFTILTEVILKAWELKG